MSGEPLTFSIVIATYNRPGPLAVCLEACAAQDFPRERFEVIVVDDGGGAPLQAVLGPFEARLNISLITQANGGPGPARNTGAAHARGRYLAFTDDDCAPEPGWLRALAARLDGRDGRLVGGRIVNGLPDNPYCTASQATYDLFHAHLLGGDNPKRFFTTNNLSVPANGFRAMGGFYAHNAEDRDFCDRWLSQGHQMIYAPEAQVCHYQRLNLRQFLHLHYSYGAGAFHYHWARSRRLGGRFRFYPLSLLLMLRHPYKRQGHQAFAIAALMGLAKAANAVGFFGTALETGLARTGRPQAH